MLEPSMVFVYTLMGVEELRIFLTCVFEEVAQLLF
jgi:hypothetical protein